jgi:hypothetical protein
MRTQSIVANRGGVVFSRENREFSRRSIISRLGLAVVTLSILGCGGNHGQERVIVSGKVVFDGKPINNGRIRFTPDANSRVPSSGANIGNGQYLANLHGGVPVGTYKVEIEAYDENGLSSDEPPGMQVRRNKLPEKYNANSQLTLKVESGSRNMTKDFELSK